MHTPKILGGGCLFALLLASGAAGAIVQPTANSTNLDPAALAQPTQVVSPLAAANNAFALDLLRQASPSSDQNTFFSPYSISAALAMTWLGARGDTAAQMATALHFSNMSAPNVAADFGALQKQLSEAQKQDGIVLAIANSLWPEQNSEHPLLADFMSEVQTNFAADVFPQDYIHNPEAARLHINDWVAQKTNDKITNILHSEDVGPLTRLALVNAIYFKGQWMHPFTDQATRPGIFKLSANSRKNVTMMHTQFDPAEVGYLAVTDADCGGSLQILELPYKNSDPNRREFSVPDTSFIVILPAAIDGLAALEKGLTAEKMNGWLGQLSANNSSVICALPKFKLTARFDLASALGSLGINDAFDSNLANFAGMDGAHDLYISKVIHQAYLSVDEKGTEAAAATVVLMGFGGGAPRQAPPPIVFNADHPFLFLIREKTTRSILFLGRLANPPEATSN